MHFGPNECTQCGGVRAAYTSSKYELPSDGVIARLLGYECAFCSDRCLEKALQPYIAERFGFDKHPQNDPAIRKIVENYGLIVKLINSNTLHSVEERSKLEEHRAFHLNGLQEALDAWVEGRNNAIEAASDRFTSQWERECRAYHDRQSEKSFIEQQRAIEREQAAAERDQRYEEQKQERLRKELERKAEAFEREWEKDYFAAEAEHEKFLEKEANEEALTFKPIPEHLRIHTGIIAKTGCRRGEGRSTPSRARSIRCSRNLSLHATCPHSTKAAFRFPR